MVSGPVAGLAQSAPTPAVEKTEHDSFEVEVEVECASETKLDLRLETVLEIWGIQACKGHGNLQDQERRQQTMWWELTPCGLPMRTVHQISLILSAYL